MDLSKFSTEDLLALRSGDLTKVSTKALKMLKGESVAPQKRTTGEAFKDLGASALQGVGSIVALPGQIYGAVTGDVDNAVSKAGAGIRDYGESLKSEELKFKQEELRAKAAEAAKNGVLDEFLTTLKGTATDPALLAALLAEFAPNLIPGAAIARGAGALGRGAALARGATQEVAEKAGTRIGTGAAIGAGATLEGGGAFEETYKEAMDLLAQQGVTGPQAEEIALAQARKAGAATTAATAAVGAVPGFRGLESILAGGGAKGALRTGLGEFTQGVAEGATTTVPGNVSLQSIDPSIETFRGTGSAAATEALGGGVAGTTFGAFGQDDRAPKAPAGEKQPDQVALQRERFAQEKAAKAQAAEAAKAQKLADEGEKLLNAEQKAQAQQERERKKALDAVDKAETAEARQKRYADLVDAFGEDFSGSTNYAALVQERAALEALPKTTETKRILSNLNKRISELDRAAIEEGRKPTPPTQEDLDAEKAAQSAFGGAAPAQGDLFPMDRGALGNEPPAAEKELVIEEKPNILTRNKLLGIGLGQGATIAKGVNPLVAAQAKAAGIRAQQPYENSLVGLDLSKPEDVREAQRILDRVDQNPLIADDTKASLRKLIEAQPELNQRRLNFEGETTETILAKQENYNKAMSESKKTALVGGPSGDGSTDTENVPPLTRRAGKTTGAQFFAQQRQTPSNFSRDTGLPPDTKVTFADIAAALEDDLKDNAGRANQWFSEANRKKLEETFVGKTPAEIKAMTIKGKPGSLMDAVYTELTKQAPAPATEPTVLKGESDAVKQTPAGNDADPSTASGRAQAEPEPNATDVQSDSNGRGTTGPVVEQPAGTGMGTGVRDSEPVDGGEGPQPGSLKPSQPKEEKPYKPEFSFVKNAEGVNFSYRGFSFTTAEDGLIFADNEVLREGSVVDNPLAERAYVSEQDFAKAVDEEVAQEYARARKTARPKLPSVFIHGTSKASAEKIKAEGVINPSVGAGNYDYSELGYGAIYLARPNSWWLDKEKAAKGRAAVYDAQVEVKVASDAKIKRVDTPADAVELANLMGYADPKKFFGDLFFDTADEVNGTSRSKAIVAKFRALGFDALYIGPNLGALASLESAAFTPPADDQLAVYNPDILSIKGAEPKAKKAVAPKETKTRYRGVFEGQPATITVIRRVAAPEKIDAVSIKVDGERLPFVNLGAQGVVTDEAMLKNLVDTEVLDSFAKGGTSGDQKGVPTKPPASEPTPEAEVKPFEPLPADKQVSIRPQDFKKKSDEDLTYQYVGPRGEVYEYMPATSGDKGFVVRGPGMKPAFVRNQATARKMVQDTLNGVKDEPGKMPEKPTTPKTFNGPVAVVTDGKVKAEIEAKAAAEAERKAAQETKRAEEKAAEAAAKADPIRELAFEAEKDLFREKLQKLAGEDETPIKPVVDASRDAESRGFILPEEGARIRKMALANKNPSMALEDLMQRVKTAKFDPDFEASPTYKKPLYAKRVGVVEGVDPERVQEIVDEAAAESDNTPTVVVVRRQSDIPMTLLRKHFDDVAQAKGFVDLETNTVYLLPDNIASDKDIWLTYTHEVVGHYGLRAVLGGDYSVVMKAAAQNETVVAELGKDSPTERNIEEAIARISELGVDDKLPKPVLPLFTRIETSIKNFLRSLGLDIALTDRELYGLLADARTYVQSGKRKGKGVAGQPSEKSIALRSGATTGITQADVDRMEEAAGSVRAVRREEESVLAGVKSTATKVLTAPKRTMAELGVAIFDRSASVADKISRLYGTGLRDALGKINPLGLLRQAEGVSRLMDSVFNKGGIEFQADKNLYTAVNVVVTNPTSSLPEGSPASISQLFEVIKAFAKARGLDLDTAEGYLHRAMEGRRLKYMVNENKRVEAAAAKMKGAEAQKYLDDNLLVLPTNVDLDAFIAESDAAFAKEDFLRQYDDVMRAVREHAIERAVEAGVLSQEQGRDWKAALEYVPFTRLDKESDQKSVNMVARGLTAFSKIRKLVGSETKPIGNITDNFANNIGWLTSQTIRNMAAQQVLTELEAFNYAREMRGVNDFSNENAVVKVLRDGKEQYYELADPLDVNAFASLPLVTGPFNKLMQETTRFLRASVTLMPQFAISQVIQDSIRAGFNSGAKRPFQAVAKTLVNFPVVLLVESLGVNHPLVRNMKFLQEKAKAITSLKDAGTVGQYDLNVLNPAENLRFDSGVAKRTAWQKVIKAADTFTSASDMAARLAVFEQLQAEFPNDYVRPQVAARELINFNRRGSSSVVALMINAVPFFNAYLQSVNLMYRNIKGVDTTSGLTKNEMRAQMVKTAGMLFAMSTMYALMMADDEEYKNTPDAVKDRNFILPGGIAIPMPPELGVFFKVFAERMVQYALRSGTPEEQAAGEAIGGALKSVWNAYSSPNPTPQLAKPLLEAWTNYSFFTGRPIVPQSMQNLEAWEQVGAETSEFARLVGKGFNVSPMMVDQMISSTFGLAGSTVIQLTDAVLSDRGDRPLYRYPFVSTFVKNPQGGQIVNEFYDFNESVQRVKRTYDRMVETRPEEALAYLQKGNNATLYTLAGYVEDKLEVIATLREYRRYVEASKDMTGEEKRAELDAIAKYRIELLADIREVKKLAREGGGL